MSATARRIRAGALVALVSVAACDDPTAPDDTPPELPAAETMTFDFDFFDQGASIGSVAPAGPARQASAGPHWGAAALTVGLANVSVVVHLFVPVATWRAAASHSPVFEDGAWHWRYSVTQGGQSFSSDLSGFRDGDDRVFEMSISSSALQLENFLWYRGRAPIGGTSGTWEFFDPDAQSTVAGRIEWSHPAADRRILTFTAVSGENVGDELTYETDGADRFVTFFDVSENRSYEVYWDALTNAGYIVSPGYNGGEKACWDGALQNTPCA
ncbi:MAG: hypothetical protein KJO11_04355 [Gemmatimonadetes bacterium]|nr:hypothetical protein [Gemmatimonadota bacterium]MBT8404880.1 hypothetical protein [Gemmatimonadota bacterium]NNK64682.1 hypothetical protein [Gemmatimonadota bacterium]